MGTLSYRYVIDGQRQVVYSAAETGSDEKVCAQRYTPGMKGHKVAQSREESNFGDAETETVCYSLNNHRLPSEQVHQGVPLPAA